MLWQKVKRWTFLLSETGMEHAIAAFWTVVCVREWQTADENLPKSMQSSSRQDVHCNCLLQLYTARLSGHWSCSWPTGPGPALWAAAIQPPTLHYVFLRYHWGPQMYGALCRGESARIDVVKVGSACELSLCVSLTKKEKKKCPGPFGPAGYVLRD